MSSTAWHEKLKERDLSSGPVYASRLLTGKEAAQTIADFKAQESIRPDTERILLEATDPAALDVPRLVEQLATFYHSDHVKVCKSWILLTPFEEWRNRQLARRGLSLEGGEQANGWG